VNRTYLVLAFSAILLVATCVKARAADHEINCPMVRAQVKEHGKFKAYAWALANGYSPREISRIRKLCNV